MHKMYDLALLLREWHPDWSEEELGQRVELLDSNKQSQFLIPPFVEEVWQKTFENLPAELHAKLDRLRGLLVRDKRTSRAYLTDVQDEQRSWLPPLDQDRASHLWEVAARRFGILES